MNAPSELSDVPCPPPVSSGDELLLTEMIFNGLFNDLTVEQATALLSCFVFQENVRAHARTHTHTPPRSPRPPGVDVNRPFHSSLGDGLGASPKTCNCVYPGEHTSFVYLEKSFSSV